MLSIGEVDVFQRQLAEFYHDNQRDLPWRTPDASGIFDPYKIMVSEIMLQQTQVVRVLPKYQEFLVAFPDISTLASAPLDQVLGIWQGLGYNRRARYLREACRVIQDNHEGKLPDTLPELIKLPGIGINTASAILVYAFNRPHVFIETNIRTVYLYHFFRNQEGVGDTDILPIIDETIDRKNPREFYWALMDYGTYLKKTYGNQNIRSKHYVRQSAFHGSLRQLRGRILRTLQDQSQTIPQLVESIEDDRLQEAVEGLIADGLVEQTGKALSIAR